MFTKKQTNKRLNLYGWIFPDESFISPPNRNTTFAWIALRPCFAFFVVVVVVIVVVVVVVIFTCMKFIILFNDQMNEAP